MIAILQNNQGMEIGGHTRIQVIELLGNTAIRYRYLCG